MQQSIGGCDAAKADDLPAAQVPDLPPESFAVESPYAGLGRVEVNPVYDRDDSTKGTTNPKAQHAVANAKHRFSPQSYSGNLRRSPARPIIGLPNKIQQSAYGGRCKRLTSTRIFPKRAHHAGSEGGGLRKSALPDDEPSSPKVSCVGKVLSERECRRICKARSAAKKEKKKIEAEATGDRVGCWGSLARTFRCFGGGGGERAECAHNGPAEAPVPCASSRTQNQRTSAAAAGESPCLGAMQRFSSGRRPAAWAGEVEAEGRVPCAGHLDRDAASERRLPEDAGGYSSN